ncbi:MAG: hypothetical protein EOM74_00130 [Methanomicrobia archaeon]|nr:hypothetical protein [Methanomicrobia archaeon]
MKVKVILFMTMAALMLASCATGSSNSSESSTPSQDSLVSEPTSDDIDRTQNPFDTEGNFETPELTVDGLMNEPEWQDANYSSPTTDFIRHGTNTASVTFYRGEKALFVFFDVKDTNMLTDGDSNGDPVNRSDSIELYLDVDNDGINNQGDDIQINIGVNGRTRILTGSDNVWGTWNGLVSFEIAVTGTINNESDTDTGFGIEIMLPYSATNMERNRAIGFSLGAPDRYLAGGNIIGTNYDWFGLFVGETFVDPQQASAYLVLTTNQIMTRSEYNAL